MKTSLHSHKRKDKQKYRNKLLSAYITFSSRIHRSILRKAPSLAWRNLRFQFIGPDEEITNRCFTIRYWGCWVDGTGNWKRNIWLNWLRMDLDSDQWSSTGNWDIVSHMGRSIKKKWNHTKKEHRLWLKIKLLFDFNKHKQRLHYK